mgnify:CR=1 FL=1
MGHAGGGVVSRKRAPGVSVGRASAQLWCSGVDSSVAALLLKEAGHSVSTAYIRTWLNEEMPLADCPAQQDIEDSRAVAQHLNLDYEIVNLVNESCHLNCLVSI